MGERARRHKAVRLLTAAVVAVPQLPGGAADGGRVDLRADGLDAAVAREPGFHPDLSVRRI